MEAKGEGILSEKWLKVVKTQEKTTILHQLGWETEKRCKKNNLFTSLIDKRAEKHQLS